MGNQSQPFSCEKNNTRHHASAYKSEYGKAFMQDKQQVYLPKARTADACAMQMQWDVIQYAHWATPWQVTPSIKSIMYMCLC